MQLFAISKPSFLIGQFHLVYFVLQFARFINELLYDDLTADIPESSISDVGEMGEVGYSYFLAKVTNPVDTALLRRMADVGQFEVSDQFESDSDINVTAVSEYSGILAYVAVGV